MVGAVPAATRERRPMPVFENVLTRRRWTASKSKRLTGVGVAIRMGIGCLAVVAMSVGDPAISAEDGTTVEAIATDAARFARQLHKSILTIDSHVDVPKKFGTGPYDPAIIEDAQVSFSAMSDGQLDGVFLAVAVGQGPRTQAGYDRAWRQATLMIQNIRQVARRYPNRVMLATSPEDFAMAEAGGRLAFAIGLENAYAIGRDVGKLGALFDMGVRYVSLTHIGHNDVADSSNPNPALEDAPELHHGLSRFGRRVVKELNRLGIVIDVSHASKPAMLAAVNLSRAPVIASHSGVRAIMDVPRNLDDQQLRALASKGGVIQIVGYSPYIAPTSPARDQALKDIGGRLGLVSHKAWGEATDETIVAYGRGVTEINRTHPPASVADLVDHIDYVVKLVGIDHVGVGSDFYAGGGASAGGLHGWMSARDNVNITVELLRRGYSKDAIAKIWSGNLLRVMREAQAAAMHN